MTTLPTSEVNQNLTPSQRRMVRVMEEHVRAEVVDHDVEATMATMTEDPYHFAIAVGASVGAEAVRTFYGDVMLPQVPPDLEVVPISRTIGTDRIVDEFVAKFTHSIQMDWLIPGVPATNQRIEHPVVVIFEFRDGKIVGEHIYWDQASVLVQAGLIDSTQVPAVDAGVARTLLRLADAGKARAE